MKRLLLALAATTALAGCATTPAPVDTAAMEPAPAAVAATPERPKPELGTFGFDKAGMDETVRPGDNFYQFANGTWSKNTQIPADKSRWGAFNDAFLLARPPSG